MTPSEFPTTIARSTPSASSTPATSPASASGRYGPGGALDAPHPRRSRRARCESGCRLVPDLFRQRKWVQHEDGGTAAALVEDVERGIVDLKSHSLSNDSFVRCSGAALRANPCIMDDTAHCLYERLTVPTVNRNIRAEALPPGKPEMLQKSSKHGINEAITLT
jgi:hypothetical protein